MSKEYTDTDRIDFLQDVMVDAGNYTKRVILRESTTGRGYRLYETGQEGAVNSVREAIDTVMEELRQAQL